MASKTFCDLCGRQLAAGAPVFSIMVRERVSAPTALDGGTVSTWRAHDCADEVCEPCGRRAIEAPAQQSPESFIAGWLRQSLHDLAESARNQARNAKRGVMEIDAPDIVEEAIERVSADLAKVVEVRR